MVLDKQTPDPYHLELATGNWQLATGMVLLKKGPRHDAGADVLGFHLASSIWSCNVAEDAEVMGSESYLQLGDHADWRQDPDYNPRLKAPLAKAYASVQQAPEHVLSFREAGYQVLALRDALMCAPQRMNVCYILA